MLGRRVLVLALVTACGAPRSAPPPAVPQPAPAAQREPCGEGLVVEVPATVAREWNGSISIGGRLEGSVRWCGEGSIVLETATLASAASPDARVELAWDPVPLASGASRAFGIPAPGALGRAVLVVRAGAIEVTRDLEIVDDPDRVAAIAECTACGGTLRAMGMMGSEMCDCPTRDAGARCLSSADCEGACLFDHAETAPSDRCAAGEVEQTMVGRCHDRTHLFGCHPRLDEPRVACIRPGWPTRVGSTCVD